MIKLLLLPILVLAAIFMVAGPAFAQSATLVATVRPNPLQVKISIPSGVSVGQWFDISATIHNQGQETIKKTVAIIYTPIEMSVRGQKKQVGNLSGGQTKTLIWRVKANSSGEFIVTVEASGELAGEQITASDSTIVTVFGSLGAFLTRFIFGV